jgi:hypothetical protein
MGRLMVLWQPEFEEKTKMNKRFDLELLDKVIGSFGSLGFNLKFECNRTN